MSNLTNEILCSNYDCGGFDYRMKKSKINIDGPISISANNNVGEIDEYFQNYEFSFEVKFTQLTARYGLSIAGFLKKLNVSI